jgi:beta-lactamase regulating signal transducer with metallopeptidase domain
MAHPILEALGWAIIHSLWQGGAIALVFLCLDAGLRRSSANARYAAACLAMAVVLLAPAVTFVTLTAHDDAAASFAASAPGVAPSLSPVPQAAAIPAGGPARPDVVPVVWIWLAGVLAMSLWSLAGWFVAQRLKLRARQPLPEEWQERLRVLRLRLGIRRAVGLWESAVAQVPAVIGWLRPAILIPAGALLHLSTGELEAIIAHELAHVRRHDYLLNLFQSAVEILMFYHPAVWWIGRRIRAERENCCDDLAVAACGNRLVYAHALAALEELRAGPLQYAMAASGAPLLPRVRRVLGKDEPRRFFPVWVALLALLVVLLGVASERKVRAQNARKIQEQKVLLQRIEARTLEIAQSAVQPAPPTAAQAPRAPLPPAPELHKPQHQGYLAGLADAGYTDVSVDDIIELKNNGVSPVLIAGVMQSGLGKPAARQLIELARNGVSGEYVLQAAAAGIADLNLDRLPDLQRNGVNISNVRRIHELGFGPYTVAQLVELQRDGGLQPDLFAALKDSGYTKVDVRQAVEALHVGLSAGALRNLHDQGFGHLTLEQVVKLKRAGVI